MVREYVAIPRMAPPTCYVENTPLTLRHFFTEVSVLPGGGPTISALLAAAKQAARFVFPARAHRRPGADPADAWGASHHRQLSDWRRPLPTAPSRRRGSSTSRDMETIVLAMSKDPNAKLTVLLVPRGQSKPALAVKVPTTEVAEGSVVAERRLLAELQMRLPPQLLVTIPRSTEVVGGGGQSDSGRFRAAWLADEHALPRLAPRRHKKRGRGRLQDGRLMARAVPVRHRRGAGTD